MTAGAGPADRREYLRDGAEIYRRSFATIRAEADLGGLDPVVARAVVRMIHACGMVDLVDDLAASPRFGAVAQEALRAGKPLVATAVGGLPDLVGDAARLVPHGDPAALAAAVAALLDDPAAAACLAEAGRTQAATWPDEDATLTDLAAVYAELARR